MSGNLQSLAPLVGTWSISGAGQSGTVRYEWFENESFLVQHIDIVSDGEPTRGIEYIGVDPETATLRSHFFGTNGKILEYTYDLSGDTLTIWFGGPDSPAKFAGRFDASRTVNTGAWQWPGGGYESIMTRVDGDAR